MLHHNPHVAGCCGTGGDNCCSSHDHEDHVHAHTHEHAHEHEHVNGQGHDHNHEDGFTGIHTHNHEHVHEHGHNIAVVLLSMELPDAGAEGFLRALRQDAMHWRIPVIAVLRDGNISSDMILHLETDDFMCKCHPLQDLQRRVSRLLAVKAYRERELLLQDEACRDYLTGLFNRRGLFTAVDALRQEDLPLALYLFDVDDLKAANDQMGHEAGDILLRSFGDVLRANTREGDILCRYGGDEFIVVLKRISSEETIRRKGETICSNFRKLVLSNGTHAACSGGVVMCEKDEKPSATLIKKADKALYLAKKENKGSCCLWNDTLEK